MSFRLLVIDDDEFFVSSVSGFLQSHEFSVDTALSAKDGIEKLRENPHGYALIILDYHLEERGSGARVLQELRNINADVFVLIFSGDPSQEAVQATWKAGAVEFLNKASDPSLFLEVVKKWCRKFEQTHLVLTPLDAPNEANPSPEDLLKILGMVGRSPSLFDLTRKVKIYKESPRSVLILGESGTGKELIAKALHREGSFTAVNCASYRANPTLMESILFGHVRGAFTGADRDRKGVFEEAEGGTVFLDEIHHLHPDAQASCLRVLQEKKVIRIGTHKEIPVQFRLLAAAKPQLTQDVEQGRFMLDLYYRIRGATLVVPPLRQRPEDIAPLILHFTNVWNGQGRRKSFLARTLRYLEQYAWPGNVRELESVVYDLLDLSSGDKVTPDDLDPKFFSKQASPSQFSNSLKDRLGFAEREHAQSVLRHSRSIREAARKMEVSPATLLRLMRRHGLEKGTQIHS